jgi:hypothetical protein
VAVKIPPFWPSDPELWFAQVEAQFTVKNITSQGTKFAHVVTALSPEAATEVRDLILTPPSTNPFDVLKATLTERVSLSKRRKIQQLLHAEELGDRKPSQLLRRLQQLHGTSDKELLRELFLQRLPSNVQIGLLSHPDKPLADLALMADGMIELTDARSSIAQIETPESAEISSIRSDLNKVLKLLDTGARKPPADPKLVKEGLRSLLVSHQIWYTGFEMSLTLYLYGAGKREARSPVEAHVSGGSSSRLLYVTDKHSKTRFLIDTGAEVSVFPATQHDKRYCRKGVSLTAANNSTIHTYGKHLLCLDLGLHRQLKWSFLIAEVNQPILGADFLRHSRVLADTHNF